MEKAFTSLEDLRNEINLLKIKQFHQEEELKEKLSNPSTLFKMATSLFKTNPGSKKSFTQELLNNDIITNITRIALPLLLNGVLFKRSGFIVKTLVTFLSQSAAKKVNSNVVGGMVDKVKTWFTNKKKERTQKAYSKEYVKDYGIPPYSEAY